MREKGKTYTLDGGGGETAEETESTVLLTRSGLGGIPARRIVSPALAD
jgi:hypothetical protein